MERVKLQPYKQFRIISPKSGSVLFEGKDLLKEEAHNICKLGIAQVPEGRRIFSKLAVKDNLKLGQFTIKDSAENMEKDRADFYKSFLECLKKKSTCRNSIRWRTANASYGKSSYESTEALILDEPSMGLSPLFVKGKYLKS